MSKKNAPKYKKSRVKRRDPETYERIRKFKAYLIEEVEDIDNWDKETYAEIYKELDYFKSIMRTEQNRYWDECQELAVIVFQNVDDYFERNRVFKRYLNGPMRRMVEGLVRNEKFHFPFFQERDQFGIIEAHLLEKFKKFDYTLGFPAFSYYNTVIKNFCIQELKKLKKKRERDISYEKYYHRQEDLQIEDANYYEMDYDEPTPERNILKEMVDMIIDELNDKEKFLEDNGEYIRKTERDKLKRDIKVGNALIELFENFHIYLEDDDGDDTPIIDNKKRLKDMIILHIESITNLEAKEIRRGVKAYKTIYRLVKDKNVEEEE